MTAIFQVNQADLPWSEYNPAIRYKALTVGAEGVPPVQYLSYGPGHTDPVHSHKVGEFFIVVRGELWLGDERTGEGGIAFIPAHTEYAVRAGDEGVEYFRVVAG